MLGANTIRGPSVATAKARIPTVVHPLSTSGYVIIIQFIFACIFNTLVFIVTYSFVVVAIPISLLLKVGQKCLLCVKILSQGRWNSVEMGNTDEKYWFMKTASETRSPTLILLLIVKGRLGIDTVKYLVHNRLNYAKDSQGKDKLSRLARTPKHIFHELVWVESNIGEKPVREVKLEANSIVDLKRRRFIIEDSSQNTLKDWHIFLYSANTENLSENNVLLFQFHHCFADVYSLVHFLSRNFLDQPTFAFRDEISPTQSFCLGLMAFLSGPGIFTKSLFKSRDTFFLVPAGRNQRAIFYSKPISKLLVDTITTATSTSVSDVLLSCLAGGLRTSLQQNGVVFPRDIAVYLPMHLESSSSLKCFTSFNILSLPVGTEGAIPRLWEMRLRRNNLSSLVQAITMSTVMQLAFLILPDISAKWLIQFLMAKCSCTVTCILGQTLEEELVLDGRNVEAFLPIEDNGAGISITIIEYEEKFQLAVLAPTTEDWVIRPSQLCVDFSSKLHELSTRLTERARVVRARCQKHLNSRKNSVLIVEEEE